MMFIYLNFLHKWYTHFAIALKMIDEICNLSRWLLNFGNKFDGQEVKIVYTNLYIEL